MQFLSDRRFFVLLAAWGFIGAGYAAWMLAAAWDTPQIAFDAERWRSADPMNVEYPVRSQMVSDLLAQHRFEGWSHQELVDLLGQPQATCPGSDAFDAVFLVGPERGAGSDFQWLAFRQDDQERVVEYKVVSTGPIE